jgi:hypothetical protein
VDNRREYLDSNAGGNYRYNQYTRPVSRGPYERPPPPPEPRFLEDASPPPMQQHYQQSRDAHPPYDSRRPGMDWDSRGDSRGAPPNHIQNYGGVQINGGNVSGGIHYGQ